MYDSTDWLIGTIAVIIFMAALTFIIKMCK